VNLFDSSALLCFLQGETGAELVQRELVAGGSCSAANWSEVAQKVLQHNRDWPLARALLDGYHVTVEPVTSPDAELAASIWRPGTALSLADRLCLATAERLDAVVWTADTAWGRTGRVRQIR
jgi:ribonuclease VapC